MRTWIRVILRPSGSLVLLGADLAEGVSPMPSGGLFTYFYTKEAPELTNGVAIVPDVSSSLFAQKSNRKDSPKKKGGKAGTPSSATGSIGGGRVSTIPTGSNSVDSVGLKSPDAKEGKKKTHYQRSTHTSQTLAQMIRLSCRVNGETWGARVITVPDSITTMEALLDKINVSMKLSAKMKFARELLLPDGTKIETMEEVAAAALALTTVTVGGGEAFDEYSLEPTVAVLHAQGGGRTAPIVAKRQLSDKDRKAAQLKAQHIRNTGHGMSPLTPAVAAARQLTQNNKTQMAHRSRLEQQLLNSKRAADKEAKKVEMHRKHEEEVEKMTRRKRLQQIRNRQKRGEV